MFFLQMSGFPGSGKSTLAQLLARRTGAVIVDHDVVKSALMEFMEIQAVDAKTAGKISYGIDWSLIDFHLSIGHAVIFDSPCLYAEMLGKGMRLAEKYNVKYKYVECYLNDFEKINERLKNRNPKISQIQEVLSEKIFSVAVDSSEKPLNVEHLIIDSGKPVDSYIDEVLDYILK
ncbi:AAA family ATPase [Planomicrobium sp. CPCC 101079]|uniref:AAA family ATPase n=1 Tax=Planomicrobium sp. CPCC 101079 TaxID=2599618 RepID=UPI0011B641A5|nr:AAA family ATPase [Planomicrobium sp. CPCC 101079]TWT14564.1 ATP-binding protein [Planomicrobium sp. CPCC 101079]